MEGDALKLNFEIALEKINTLTKQNNELLDSLDQLEIQLKEAKSSNITKPETATTRYNNISREADKAMKRYKEYLKKAFKSVKSKQSKRQPV